jgi:hypothetical protein
MIPSSPPINSLSYKRPSSSTLTQGQEKKICLEKKIDNCAKNNFLTSPPRTFSIQTLPNKPVQTKVQNSAKFKYSENTLKIRKNITEKKNFSIKINEKNISIKIKRQIGSGEFNNVYEVEAKLGEVFETMVLKVPRPERDDCAQRTVYNDLSGYRILKEKFGKEDSKNFRLARFFDLELLNLDFLDSLTLREPVPISKEEEDEDDIDFNDSILPNKSDLTTLLNTVTHGCYLVEYVPKHLPNEIEKDENVRTQLKELFKFAWKNKDTLPLDLKKDNVMMENDQIVIVDPMHPQGDVFKLLISQALNSFAHKESELFKYLDPRNENKKRF